MLVIYSIAVELIMPQHFTLWSLYFFLILAAPAYAFPDNPGRTELPDELNRDSSTTSGEEHVSGSAVEYASDSPAGSPGDPVGTERPIHECRQMYSPLVFDSPERHAELGRLSRGGGCSGRRTKRCWPHNILSRSNTCYF